MKSIILFLLILLAICTCERILEDTEVLSYESTQASDDGPIEIELSKERIRLTDKPTTKNHDKTH
jgi:hypothetical protein